ncbi:Glycosyl hydrolases family 31 protein [Trichomonas vaginalis G3]|uniref:Glucosidase II subunit alpha n=1 Tax=Trichomonas vaginalis (strain ATCC PRA-98 / G3) TaxID=412133 RepID=A2DTY0_TRIV3|nr:glycosyl hydrolase [Trichomonas vaginalis G3]EAY16127.1 Glycosyl hydrolases family 31 protein [Trichomonas vaginalis G3]KAI5510456.1 alpha-glucosidase family [Trichomonas vaginalis G3]|eukprot:XP_001328350.1 glycosyl hydrolase [Trichomonas vaginalis G3]
MRDRYIKDQIWKIDPNSIMYNNTEYDTFVIDSNYTNRFNLRINILRNKTAHIKLSPAEKESFNRFDIEHEPTIIDQGFISNYSEIEVTRDDVKSTISSSNAKVVVKHNPFSLIINDQNGEAIVLNIDNSLVFETKRSKEKTPELFKENYFGGVTDVFKNGPTSVAMTFRLKGKETRLSGLPAHTLPLSLENTTEPIRFFNTDINEFELNSEMAMYGSVPLLFMHSLDRSIGVFWSNPSETFIDIMNSQDRSYSDARFMSEGGFIDVYVFLGDPCEVSDSYTQLTGRPQLTPMFALGFHQCRWGYMTQSEIEEISSKLDNFGIPHDVMWLDLDHVDNRKYFTFRKHNFPDPKKMLKNLEKDGRYLVALSDPHMVAENDYYLYKEANSNNYLVKTRDNNVYFGNCWPGRSVWPDYFNPAVRAWWETLYSFKHYKESARNLYPWNDMNEISVFDSPDNTAPRDLIHYGNLEEREVHNAYGHLMVSSTWCCLRKRTKQPMRPFILSRSFFAGSQKYIYTWIGDNVASYEHMRNSLQMMMSFGLGEMIYTGADVGGFFNSPDETLLSRWFAVGAWIYPFFREHCHHLSEYREVYKLKEEASRELSKTAIHERYKILPYWYTLAREANLTGKPIIRPMWYEFPRDEKVLDVYDQVMLGSDLLIVPFLDKGQTDRKFIKPNSTKWYDFRTLQLYDSDVAKYIDGNTLVLMKAGTIIPMKSRIRKSAKMMFYDPFTLVIALDEKGFAQGKLYVDDGESEEFEKGSFVYREFTFENGTLINRAVPPRTMNKFGYKYDVTIERIKITGLKEPKSIKGPKGRIDFDYEDSVLTIRKPNLLIRDDWSVALEFDNNQYIDSKEI